MFRSYWRESLTRAGRGWKKGNRQIFKRLIAYSQKVFGLSDLLTLVADGRLRPQIPTARAASAVLAMFLGRLGSLNSVEQLSASPALKNFIGNELPSADSLGRIMNLSYPSTIRKVNHQIYSILKSNKALAAPAHEVVALTLDGHESHSSYKRHCSGCLARKKVIGGKEVAQYYHRNVTAQLVFRDLKFMLDAEPQLPGEGEITCALRLLDRVLIEYARAFQVVVMDALYARSNVFNKIVSHGKNAIAVLKDERRDLRSVAENAFKARGPDVTFRIEKKDYQCWEHIDSESWNQVDTSVRVIRSIESKSVRENSPKASWTWVTTILPDAASISTIVQISHSRWCIENEGFNELSNHWHADHVYKHDAVAIQNFWLMAIIAYNLLRAFYIRYLKPAVRKGKYMLHFARTVRAELYFDSTSVAPP